VLDVSLSSLLRRERLGSARQFRADETCLYLTLLGSASVAAGLRTTYNAWSTYKSLSVIPSSGNAGFTTCVPVGGEMGSVRPRIRGGPLAERRRGKSRRGP
jgi:hypothetical protein